MDWIFSRRTVYLDGAGVSDARVLTLPSTNQDNEGTHELAISITGSYLHACIKDVQVWKRSLNAFEVEVVSMTRGGASITSP